MNRERKKLLIILKTLIDVGLRTALKIRSSSKIFSPVGRFNWRLHWVHNYCGPCCFLYSNMSVLWSEIGRPLKRKTMSEYRFLLVTSTQARYINVEVFCLTTLHHPENCSALPSCPIIRISTWEVHLSSVIVLTNLFELILLGSWIRNYFHIPHNNGDLTPSWVCGLHV